MKVNLPIIKINGDDFNVNVKYDRLEYVQDRRLIIPLSEAKDEGDGYRIKYDPALKGLPDLHHFEEFVSKTPLFAHYFLNELPDHQLQQLLKDFEAERGIVDAKIQPLKDLDPQEMAKKYHLEIKDLAGKTDWEIIVDQRLYSMRVHSGMLPQLIIDDHPFYVDYRMNELRPHDDFSNTIRFQELIQHNIQGSASGLIRVPYLPAKHSLGHIDVHTVTAIPKGTLIVDIPLPDLLDPVGVARDRGLDVKDYLRTHPLMGTTVASTVPWKDTILPGVIEKNKKARKTKKRKGIK